MINEKIEINVSTLGFPVNTIIKQVFHSDPETGNLSCFEYNVKQRDIESGCRVEIKGNEALITIKPKNKIKKLIIPSEIILANSLYFPYLIRDFLAGHLFFFSNGSIIN